MQVKVEQGAVQETSADTIIVNLFNGVTEPAGATGAVDKALGGAISEIIASGDLRGQLGEVAVLYPRGQIAAKRVLVAGLGDQSKFDHEAVRRAAAAAIRKARSLNAQTVATIVHGGGIGGLDLSDAAQSTVEGSLLASYEFDAPKAKSETTKPIEALVVVEHDATKLDAIRSAAKTAEAIATGVAQARDLVNLPPNMATPTRMAEIAQTIAEDYGLGITIGDRAWAKDHDMGAFLAVAAGAGEEPKFIVMELNSGRQDLPTIVLVGKGITFDTGGISIKGSEGMWTMKGDMGGAAAVIGAMKAIAALDLPAHVVAITPCTENMPDAHAYRPADVITASNGKTIEIISTDAEGRMVLADGLVYAQRYDPDYVIDLATLTGSCVVALGKSVAAGIFSNDDTLRDDLLAAADATYERLWPLPLYEDYRRAIDSDVADMKNSGGRMGGVGTSAVFLQEFTDYPWAHLDIAGMGLADKPGHYGPVGGTGYGVRLLVAYVRRLAGA